jgi:hypothetical protein
MVTDPKACLMLPQGDAAMGRPLRWERQGLRALMWCLPMGLPAPLNWRLGSGLAMSRAGGSGAAFAFMRPSPPVKLAPGVARHESKPWGKPWGVGGRGVGLASLESAGEGAAVSPEVAPAKGKSLLGVVSKGLVMGKKLQLRIFTSLILAVLVTYWVFGGTWVFTTGFLLQAIIAQGEYYNMCIKAGVTPARRISFISTLLMFVIACKYPAFHELVLPMGGTAVMIWLLLMRKVGQAWRRWMERMMIMMRKRMMIIMMNI